MRIAVMGAGGTGGYFGGLLARAGHDVIFIARGAHLAALQAHGLTVSSHLAGDFTVAAQATDDPAAVGPVELVLFCVKAYDLDAAARVIRPLVGPQTMVLPVQNGIDHPERLARMVGEGPIVGGVALLTAALTAPGAVAQTAGLGKIVLGELDGHTSERIVRLRTTFEDAGIPVAVRSDILVALWEKFIFICAFGGVTALTRLPIGPILASVEGSALLCGVMEEVAAVARARGIALPGDSVERSMALARSFEPWARGSLAHDLAAGRRLEVETLNGTVVRLGHDHAVATPFNFVVYAALQPYTAGALVLP